VPPPDASPDAAAEAAADVASAPDAAVDAAELPDVASRPDAQPDALPDAQPDAASSPDAGLEAGASEAGVAPSRPPLTFVADEQSYWVLYESYPGDGRGTPVIRDTPIMPNTSRIANGTDSDRTTFSFQSCASTGTDGCEAITLTQVPPLRVCIAGACSNIPETNEICANPSRAGVPPNCSASASSFAASSVYMDRLGRRRVNYCWTAALAPNVARPAIWAVRGVAGRTAQAARGDFCVFGYPAP
jgi:hypothetical protein